ncbi:MAG: putative metal-dependent membrane protease [Phormidesmis priestleyi Ana]|uniref:Putative metal-dependent membrane protease n=1 Tax=Phormidesmis priestleyi Ana TaxID=1666911 RepID=A0A0P8C4V7_9CYAN|nr:MAG: putative metal-dependent membrane protease [Phormidesmis priestleyi Ana]
MASLLMGIVYSLLAEWRVLPSAGSDPILTPISTISILTIMVVVILWVGQLQGLKINRLFGRRAPRFSIFYAVLLVASLLLFSLGIPAIIFYFLSLFSPGYVAQLLEISVTLSGTDSMYPQLYERLMLFLLLIYAPVVEELIFRGILLQRWSTKWGLRWGLIASSVLFGLLHPDNPPGLMLFGLVMGLLYVRTGSLWVPIACHSLNNLAAVGIDRLHQMTSGGQVPTVGDIQQLWWISLILVGVSLPLLVRFIWQSWPPASAPIPYLAGSERASQRVNRC